MGGGERPPSTNRNYLLLIYQKWLGICLKSSGICMSQSINIYVKLYLMELWFGNVMTHDPEVNKYWINLVNFSIEINSALSIGRNKNKILTYNKCLVR